VALNGPALYNQSCASANDQAVLYLIKTAKQEHYPIPDAPNPQDVLALLRDHSVLSNVFFQVAEIRRNPSK
jgi:hypothetical protein